MCRGAAKYVQRCCWVCAAVLLGVCRSAVGRVPQCCRACAAVLLGVCRSAVGRALRCCQVCATVLHIEQAVCKDDDEKFLLLGQRLYIVSHLWLFTIKK